MQQRSDEWFLARCGKVTASRIADLLARTKSGYGASRANYMAELLTERLTGQPIERYSNAAMEWGTMNEPAARAAYEISQGVIVEEVGFILHPSIADSGASPDGLIDECGLVELKAPNTATHIDTLLSEAVPDKYVKQMQWQMACADRHWCDFVSFDPRLPSQMQIFVKRVKRDQKMIEEMEAEVRAFLRELEEKVRELELRYIRKDAA